ncbi:hypothetical protein FGF1_02640 [Flavobacteriaceae bacterium GF1]
MKKHFSTLLLVISGLSCLGFIQNNWLTNQQEGFSINHRKSEEQNIKEYIQLFKNGKEQVELFFKTPFSSTFNVYIHSTRTSLDSTWQKDWNIPGFKSQCWMVASGVASRLDILSPKKWDSLACEHSFANTTKTQRLLTHELVHVYHGQRNPSPDFSDVNGIDWFVEGLAVYASGQLDKDRLTRLNDFLSTNQPPSKLSDFWKGNNKYGLSGSMVKYIDIKYGRKKLIELLGFNQLEGLLKSLGTTENELIMEWRETLKSK